MRIPDAPEQGRKGEKMAEIILTRNNFEEEVLKADKPVIVDFWAPWCRPCRVMAPLIEELSESSEGKYEVGKVNIDEEPELAENYGILSIPTVKIFKNGQVTATNVGVTTPLKILRMLR